MRQVPHPDPEPHTCPRCLGGVPNEEMRGQYPGALSRTDNLTEVCSNCGTMEAMEQMGGVLYRQADWPLAGGPTRSLQDILSDPEDPDRAPAPSQRTGGRRSEFIEDPEGSANLPRHPDGSVDIESLRGGESMASHPSDWEQFPHATNITETMDTINRRGEDRDPLGGGEIVHGDDGRMRGMAFPASNPIADAIRRGYYGDDTHSGLPGDRFGYDDMNPVGPDYSQPDPFDTSNPEEAAQAENIEETEQLFSQWDEERDRRRRGL